MKLLITNSDYRVEDKEPVITLDCRNEEHEYKQLKVKGKKPYFFIDKDADKRELEIAGFDINYADSYTINGIHVQIPYRSLFGKDCIKITVDVPRQVSDFREGFDWSGESGINFYYRWLIDKGIRGYIEVDDTVESCEMLDIQPRVCFLDIEVDNYGGGVPDTRRANKRIIGLTAYDSYDEEYISWLLNREGDRDKKEGIRVFNNERDLLNNFFNWVNQKNPDIFSGYNVGDFDLKYLIRRSKRLNSAHYLLGRNNKVYTSKTGNLYIGRRNVLDLYNTYRWAIKGGKRNRPKNWKLDTICEKELGTGKIKHGAKTIGHLWRKDQYEMVKYNKRDVKLCVDLADHMGTVETYTMLCADSSMNMNQAGSKLRAIENSILHELHDDNPLKRIVKPYESPYSVGKKSGGEVIEPKAGVYENVVYVDFSSLYPSIIISLNISPETKVNCKKKNCKHYTASNGVCFSKEREGIIPKIVSQYLERRYKYKNKMKEVEYGSRKYEMYNTIQDVMKIILNSIYGVLANKFFSLKDSECSEAITQTGREVLKYVIGKIKERDYVPVVADTDGIGFTVGNGYDLEDCIEIGERTCEEIDFDKMTRDILGVDSEHRFILEIDDIYEKLLLTTKKKRYAGIRVYDGEPVDPKLKITGFGSIRSDRSDLSQRVQKEVIKKAIDDVGISDLHEYINELEGRIENNVGNRDFLNKIGFPMGITKDFVDYKKETKAVQGAKFSNKELGTNYGKGDKPMWLPVKRINGDVPENRVIAFEEDTELPDDLVVDIDEIKRKTIKDSMEKILPAVGYNWQDVKTDSSQAGLSSF